MICPAHAEASQKEILKLLFWQAPSTLNPHLSPGIKDQTASRIVYEPLATFDSKGQIVPILAAEIPSLGNGQVAPDGRSVTWKLKRGVKWSDGAPFTAKDVVFTYTYVTNPDVASSSVNPYKAVAKVEALDDYTVQVTFRRVNPAWAQPFVGIQGMILPEHVFAPFNNKDARRAPVNLAPVGTGPYKLREFVTEDVLIIGEDVVNTVKATFEPNPNYRDADKLVFKEVVLRGGGDATVAANAVMKEGIVDYVWNLQIDDEALKAMEAVGVGKIVLSWGAYVERIMFNFSDPNRETPDGERSSTSYPHPALTDRRVRAAISMAVDRAKIASLYGRTGKVTANILVSPPFESPMTSWEFNPQKANALLDEAGWKDSDGDGVRDKDGVALKFLFQTSVNPVRQKSQEIVKASLAAVGIAVENKMIDGSVFLASTTDSTNTRQQFYADLEEYAYGNKVPDPGVYMSAWTCGEAAQKANNWSLWNVARYCNPVYDDLFKASAGEVNPDRRRDLFIQMNDFLISDFAVLPIVHWADVTGIAKDLEGFAPTPWDSDTWNIATWHRK
jgi:peptide/nickel transport system substrate-binding protein